MSTVISARDIAARTNPFVGPRSLRFGEKIHGRDRELDQLRDAVVADRVVLLYSPSGAGKSSLLEAGLRPALEAKGFFVAPTIRVNQDVPGNRYAVSAMLSLEEALPADARQGSEALGALTLAAHGSGNAFSALHPDREICLIIDQFEEVFTLDPVDLPVKAEFFEQLGELLRDRGVWAVIAMREDYIAQLDAYLGVFPRRLATRMRLDFLDERAALASLRNPAAAMGVEFTDEAARSLVGDLRTVIVTRGGEPIREQGPYVEPVQLQVVCSQLWTRLPKGTTLVTNAAVEQYADTDNALAQFYADQVKEVAATTDTSERSIRDWFEQHLVTSQGFRSQTFGFPGDHGLDVLKALEDAYLIRADSRRGVKWYELTHDRMIAPVLEDNAEWREARLSPLQKRAAEWDAKDRPDGLLVTGNVLTEAESWLSGSLFATDVERAFITAARQHELLAQAELQRHADQVKRARSRSFVFAALAITAVAGLIVATVMTRRANNARGLAETSRREVDARDLAARSTTLDDPYDAALLALEAELWTDAPVLQPRIAWRTAVGRIGQQPALLSRNPITSGAGSTTAVAFSPAGTIIATGNDDGTLRMFDATTASAIGDQITTGAGATTAVAFSPAGTIIATGNADGTLRMFDATTAQPIGDPITTGARSTTAVAWNSSGTIIATGNADGTLQMFDAATTTPIGDPIRPGDNFASALAWNPAGTILATGNADGTLRLFDATTAKQIGDPIPTLAGSMTAVAWNPSGTNIATGNDDGTLRLFDATTANPIGDPITTGKSFTTAVAWNPSGTIIATGNGDGTLWLFDATAQTLTAIGDQITTGAGSTRAVAWNPEGTIIATGNHDGTVRMFDATTTPIGEPITTGARSIRAVAWNPTGTIIATGNDDGTLRLFDATTAQPIGDPITTGERSTRAVAWNPTGTIIATGNDDGTLRLFDATTAQPIGDPITTGAGSTWAVAWNPTGTIIATGNDDGTLRLFDATTAQPIGDPITTGQSFTTAVAWNPTGTIIATGNGDGTLRLFDAAAQSHTAIGDPIPTGDDFTLAVAWNPTGTIIATGNGDGTLRLFDAAAQSHAAIGDPIPSGAGSTWAVAWNRSGTIIATANGDRTLRLFDATAQSHIAIGDPIPTGESVAFTVAWNPEGTIIATGNDDGTLRLFYSWTESAACAYLRGVIAAEDMDRLVGIQGEESKCAHGEVGDLTPIPVLDRPLP